MRTALIALGLLPLVIGCTEYDIHRPGKHETPPADDPEPDPEPQPPTGTQPFPRPGGPFPKPGGAFPKPKPRPKPKPTKDYIPDGI